MKIWFEKENGKTLSLPLSSFRSAQPKSPAPPFSLPGPRPSQPVSPLPLSHPLTGWARLSASSPSTTPASTLSLDFAQPQAPRSPTISTRCPAPRTEVESARAQAALPFPISFPLASAPCAQSNHRQSSLSAARHSTFRAIFASLRTVVSIAFSPAFSRCFSRFVSWPLGPCPRVLRASAMAPPRSAQRGRFPGRVLAQGELASSSSFSRCSRQGKRWPVAS